MTKETDSYSYEITLRAVGQALEALAARGESRVACFSQ
jgi:hypothetical protein